VHTPHRTAAGGSVQLLLQLLVSPCSLAAAAGNKESRARWVGHMHRSYTHRVSAKGGPEHVTTQDWNSRGRSGIITE
jgi:hypothetical protein